MQRIPLGRKLGPKHGLITAPGDTAAAAAMQDNLDLMFVCVPFADSSISQINPRPFLEAWPVMPLNPNSPPPPLEKIVQAHQQLVEYACPLLARCSKGDLLLHRTKDDTPHQHLNLAFFTHTVLAANRGLWVLPDSLEWAEELPFNSATISRGTLWHQSPIGREGRYLINYAIDPLTERYGELTI